MSHSTRNKPCLAEAGANLHRQVLEQLRQQSINEGAVELLKKSDFVKFRDKGFSICKAIRGSDGRAVKVFDENNKRRMISIPDFVDYRKDIIIELKTLHFRSPPDKGGIFVTKCSQSAIPQGYEDATEELERYIEARCATKYKAQFERYKVAYLKATGHPATLHVYVVPYAKVRC